MPTLSTAGMFGFLVLRALQARIQEQRIYRWKFLRCLLLLGLSSGLATVTLGRSAALDLRYRFPLGQTNVYHVEVLQRGESGLETTVGNVFLVPVETGSNVVRISYRTSLEVKREADGFSSRGFGGMYPGRFTMPGADRSEVQIDDRGRILRDAGDYPLPIPFGTLMGALIQLLPESPSATKWESTDDSTVIDAPYWLGPSSGISPPQFGPPFYMNYGQRGPAGVLAVSQRAVYRVTAATAETVTIHKQLTLHSLLKHGADPRTSSTVEGDLVFDRAGGLFRQMEVQGTTLASTETVSRSVRVSLKCQLLQGADLAAALAPPVPVPTPKPTVEELPEHKNQTPLFGGLCRLFLFNLRTMRAQEFQGCGINRTAKSTDEAFAARFGCAVMLVQMRQLLLGLLDIGIQHCADTACRKKIGKKHRENERRAVAVFGQGLEKRSDEGGPAGGRY